MTSQEYTRKTALISGASRGLGYAIAARLAEEGWRLALTCLKQIDAARDIAGDGLALTADLRNADEVRNLVETVARQTGTIDLLICNAGISFNRILLRTSGEEWDDIINVNLSGTMRLCREAIPYMPAGSQIILIGSRAGTIGKAGLGAYAASKAAIVGFGKSLAKELDDVRVNILIPGYMPTEMGLGGGNAAVEAAKEDSLLGALCAPHEAAAFVTWLAQTKGITGQVFHLDSRTC